jgi:hypothetical protein
MALSLAIGCVTREACNAGRPRTRLATLLGRSTDAEVATLTTPTCCLKLTQVKESFTPTTPGGSGRQGQWGVGVCRRLRPGEIRASSRSITGVW